MFASTGIAAFDRVTRTGSLYGQPNPYMPSEKQQQWNDNGKDGAGALERKGSGGWWANGGSGFRGSLQSVVNGGKSKSMKGIRGGIAGGSAANAAAAGTTTTTADGGIIVGGRGAEHFAVKPFDPSADYHNTNLNQTTDYGGGVQVAVANYGYGSADDDPFAKSVRPMGGIGEDGRTIATGLSEVPLGSPVTPLPRDLNGGLLTPYYTPSTPNVAGVGAAGDAGYPRWSGSDAYNAPSPGIVPSANGYPSGLSNSNTVSGYEDGLWNGNGLGEVVWKGTGKTKPYAAAGPPTWQQGSAGGAGGVAQGGEEESLYSDTSYRR